MNIKYLYIFLIIIFSCNEIDNVNISEPEYVKFNFNLENETKILSQNLDLSYFNDITIGVKNFSENNVTLITASNVKTVEISGSNIENLNSHKVILSPHGEGESPYANYIGLGQIIKTKTNKIYGLYHGEWHDGSVLPGGTPGFYASIGLISSDDGISYNPSSEAVIPNYISKEEGNGAGDGGYGEPSMLYSKDSSEIFVYYVDHNRNNRGVNICMGKFNVNNTEPDFNTFYFLNENKEFTSSIIKGKEVVYGEEGKSDAIFPHVTYNKTLDLYIMVYNLNAFNGSNCNLSQSGIYISYSKNGKDWTKLNGGQSFIGESKKLINDCSIPFSQNSSFAWHPSIIYTNNDQTKGYLLYSKASSLSYPGHQLVGSKFVIEIE